MTPAPAVSIIIPAHNAASTLAETLDSIARQRYADYEVLVVDDNSTDDTARIVAAHSASDSRIRTLRASTAGASAARNAGIGAALGQWLLFLDSDDLIAPSLLERLSDALRSNPAAVAAYCGYRQLMPDGGLSDAVLEPRLQQQLFETFARHCAVAIHAVLVQRAIVQRVGGFDVALRTCEDWYLWQRIARTGQPWVYVDEALAIYRLRPSSLSSRGQWLIRDGLTVIERGFAPDDSDDTISAPQHRRGATAVTELGSREQVVGTFFLWQSVIASGHGESLRLPTNIVTQPPEDAWVTKMLLDALCFGARALPAQLAARWPRYGEHLTATLARLSRELWNDSQLARRWQYALEDRLLALDGLSETRALGLTIGVRVQLRAPAPLEISGSIDRVYARLFDGERELAVLKIGALGSLTRSDWIRIASAHGFISRKHMPRSLWTLHAMRKLRIASALAKAERRHLREPKALRAIWRRARADALQKPPLFARSGHFRALNLLQAQALESANRTPNPTLTATPTPSPTAVKHSQANDRRSTWEQTFEQADPWGYGSAYEQEKYQRQLSLLPTHNVGTVLELACAEGHLTVQLAPRCQRLIAADISQRAIDRARARMRGSSHVEFRRLDLIADTLPGPVDAIICSEVLYYVENKAVLATVTDKIMRALEPGGLLICAHALIVREDMAHSGFDWANPVGARGISEVLTHTRGLTLERSLRTELYWVECFRRLRDGEVAAAPTIETLPITAELEPQVARQVIWGGAVACHSDLVQRERPRRLPVLMYHRIASDGPASLARYRVSTEQFEAQMRWLRQNGYHTLVSNQLSWYLEHDEPFYGRPLLITFDDGYEDFAEHAWPILQRYNFTAEVFVVTDLVGRSARWDAANGDAAALMSASTIVDLAAHGVRFGSHLATHRPADALSTHELASELLRSRAVLERWLGTPPLSLAAPFGITDERMRLLAAECGYRIAFTTEEGWVRTQSMCMALPRIEVHGGLSLADFAQRMDELRSPS